MTAHPHTNEVITAIIFSSAAVIGCFAFLMWYVRKMLIPYVKETHKQVSENHHSNEVPTVLDRIDDIANAVEAVGTKLDDHIRIGEAQLKQLNVDIDEARQRKWKLW